MKKVPASIQKQYRYLKLYLDDMSELISALAEIGNVKVSSPHFNDISISDLAVLPKNEIINLTIRVYDGNDHGIATLHFSDYSISLDVSTDDHAGMGIVAKVEQIIIKSEVPFRKFVDRPSSIFPINISVYAITWLISYLIVGISHVLLWLPLGIMFLSTVLWIKIASSFYSVEISSRVRGEEVVKFQETTLGKSLLWLLVTIGSSAIAALATKYVGT